MDILRDKNGLTEQEFLEQYSPGNYPRPSVTVDMLIFAAPGLVSGKSCGSAPRHLLTDGSLKLLLVKRGGHPFLGCYALPGGFAGPGETVMGAAKRELLEETHVEGVPLRQLYTFSKPGRDPRTWVMSCAHLAVLDSDRIYVEAGDDASDAGWFSVTLDMPGEDLYRLTLTRGEVHMETLIQCPSVFDEESCSIKTHCALAFDHSLIILCGLKKLFRI